jgi:hypothetical protein
MAFRKKNAHGETRASLERRLPTVHAVTNPNTTKSSPARQGQGCGLTSALIISGSGSCRGLLRNVPGPSWNDPGPWWIPRGPWRDRLAVMFCRRPVTLRGVFVMLCSLRMSFPGHAILLNDVATPKNSSRRFPLSGRWLPGSPQGTVPAAGKARGFILNWTRSGPLAHRGLLPVGGAL